MLNQEIRHITNFRQVNDWLYRGGQPELDQLEQLRELEIKTIICLRWNSRAILSERQKAIEMGFNFYYLPFSYWVLPKEKEISKFFEILDDESKRPMFVHCKHGCDRTGMLVAFYRIAREGWSADDAYQEMKDAGFHKIRMRHFKWWVYGFERKVKMANRKV